jgi:hypothetical protein
MIVLGNSVRLYFIRNNGDARKQQDMQPCGIQPECEQSMQCFKASRFLDGGNPMYAQAY